ncbi:aspartate/glutamate racemase family protein [Crassaminicella profunda]|uniref:aspartate/glutamate racemase family protein n=1 Tax=Crassaminicella profunda TaxID=1286698 RepID=UPI001CA75AB2|nr:aspartate/glutamate racemase family protein [Crassaminicella profunda]QZY56623.1 aspartate/glutamate racemase family protein [Crassaminicella profunda]
MSKKYKIAVIRVATLDDEKRLNLHGKLIEKYFPDLITKSYCIHDQYDGVHDDTSHVIATEKIVTLVKQIKHEYDGIAISCAGDPAVEILKKEIDIPVIGAGHSVASFSLNFGEKIGVLGIRHEAPEKIVKILGDKLVKSIKPEKVNNTNDLLTDEGRASVIEAAHEIQKSGAVAIILACTGMSTIGIAKFLNEKLQIPIIDPVYSEALVMNSLCKYKNIF